MQQFKMIGDDPVQDFNLEIESGQIIVDFYATWCKPCNIVARTLGAMEQDLSIEGVNILKVDIDEFPELKEQYGITALPCLVYFLNGTEKSRLIGAHTQATIRKELFGYEEH